jgi:hypothetical protein
MTISADGNFAESDSGVGVRQPGWHGVSPGTSGGGPRRRRPDPGGNPPPPDPPEECDDPCKILAQNYVACWDGYYERYLKAKPPTDPNERRAWEEDRQQKLGECDDKLKELMECRESAGGPCGAPALASVESRQPDRRQLAGQAPAVDPGAVFATASSLTALEESYEDSRVPWPGAGDWFVVVSLDTGNRQRGRLNSQGRFDDLILLPDHLYLVGYLDPARRRVGLGFFRSAGNGQFTTIPAARLLQDSVTGFADTDGDGLADLAENIVGTDTTLKDTDADGTPDDVEVRTGSNPLDGVILQPGVRAIAPTTANAFALAVENGIAAVLEDNRSVSFFDVRDPVRPIALARANVPGIPVALALEWPLLAIAQAGGSAPEFRGVTLVDISNPAAPVIRWSRSIDSASIVGIALGYGRVYASPGTGGLSVLDQAEGTILGSVQIAGHELRIVGDRLYALASSGFLSSKLTCARLSPAEALPTELGGVDVPGGPESNTSGTRLFAQANEVFVGTSVGYRVVDVRDPQTPVLLPGASAVPGRIHDFAKDSSPLLLALTSFSGPSTLQVMFFDTTNLASNTNQFLILQTPGDPSGIRLYGGHAYIADFQGGLAVLDYRLPDTGTNAPSIELRTYPTESSPAQHQGGTPLHLSARAQDDVVVRDVEFHVDGQRYVTVGSHPFETDVPTPIWRPFKTKIVVRARATDTAGNATWSEPVTIQLIPDGTPPHVVSTIPAAGFVQLEGTSADWTATFSEPMNPATLNPASILVLAPGPDDLPGTADDQPVANVGLTVSTDATAVSVHLPGALVAGIHRVVIRSTAADSNNLPMETDYVWPFEVRKPIYWSQSGAGNWSVIANWSTSRLPGTNDFVIIRSSNSESLVTLDLDNTSNPFAVDLQALTVYQPFRFQGTPGQGQFLSVVQGAQFFAPVTFASSASLNGGPWRFTGGIQILPQRIVELGSQPGTYGFPGQLTLGFPGTVSRIDDAVLRPLGGALLHHVAGSTLELRSTGEGTGYAFIDAANQFTGPTTRFLNEGLITKTGPGTFTIGVPSFQNLGVLDVQTGKLAVVSPFGQSGTIAQDGVLRVAAGATTEFQQFASSIFTLGRLARLEGEGLVQFSANIEVLGPYEFPGATRFLQSVKFADRVRTSGSWMSRQAVEFAGLSVELTGPVEFNGGNVKFSQATEAVLPDVRITRDTTFAGARGATFGKPLTLDLAKLTVQTPVRFAAPVLIKNDLSAFDAGGSFEFAGTAPSVWDGGSVNLTGGTSRILPGATFEARSGGTLSAKGFRNEGTFRKSTDSTITLGLVRPPAGVASFLNTGLFEVTGGSLTANTEPGTFVNTGTARFVGGQLVLRLEYLQSQGETVLAGGTLATRGQVSITGGVLRGAGTVVCGNVALGNAATLEPGAPIGILSITNTLGDQTLGDGSLSFNRTSRLIMDIGGKGPGLEHDQIQATGDLNLNGTLEVRLANGFTTALGDEFTLISARTRRTPKFATETLPSLGAGRKFEVVYEAAAVKLRVVAGP